MAARQSRPPPKRDQVWQRRNVLETRQRVRFEWKATSAEDALESIRKRRSSKRFQDALETFWVIVTLLERHATKKILNGEQIEQLHRIATSILSDHDVDSRHSRLRLMPAALHEAMAAVSASDGAILSAAWREELARRARGEPMDDSSLDRLDCGLLDDAPAALIGQLMDAELALEVPDLSRMRLARARLLRLTGAATEAADVLATVSSRPPLAPALVWEKACAQATSAGHTAAMDRALRVDRAMRTVRRAVDFWLWSHAEKSKERQARAPRVATLRKRATKQQSWVSDLTLHCARVLERCYSTGIPMNRRLAALGDALVEAKRIPQMDHRLLFWAAATRWLVRARRKRMAAVAGKLYREACLALSEGTDSDVFGVLRDVTLVAPAVMSKPVDQPPPFGRLARHTELARMTAALCQHQITSVFTRIMGRDHTPQTAKRHAAELGDIAAHFMGHLKGPVMKVGQMMSFYGFDMPGELTDALSELRARASPMSIDLARTVIEEDLGHPVEALFSELDEVPIGVGSIGQVHRARMRQGGREVAVKVQFPNVRSMIRGDLRALRLATPLMQTLLPRWNVAGVLDELESRIVTECDYRREASSQRWFRSLLAHRDELVIPEVFDALSSERVLTSAYFHGDSYDVFRSTADAAARAKAGSTIITYVMETVVKTRHFNTDIHPGNFLFADGRVCVVDFGSVRSWPEPHAVGWENILRACIRNDVDAFAASMTSLGMVVETPFDWQWAFDLLRRGALGAVANSEPVRLSMEDVRVDFSVWVQPHPDIRKVIMPPEWLYGFRAYWGFLCLMAGMNVELPYQALIGGFVDAATPLNKTT